MDGKWNSGQVGNANLTKENIHWDGVSLTFH